MEKINIYVPDNVGRILENDASLFEIFKRDGRTVNKNRFLSMLITGFYGQYVQEYTQKYDAIKTEMAGVVKSTEKRDLLAESIMKNVILPEVPTRKGKNPKRLSLKPTKDTESLIIKIMTDLGDSDYISQYFCRLLMSYCDKPLNEREQIIFRDNYELLGEACKSNRPVAFTTIWNKDVVHEVIPYRVVIGQGEMFNYLVCAEQDERSGVQVAKTFRLNRITNLNRSNRMGAISDDVKRHLDMMLYYGPQFAINDDEESCVRLTDYGEKAFSRIYYGRPCVDRVEHREDGHYYFFKGSKDQIFLYFRKFGFDDAEVIAPESLRQKMISFHRDALSVYKED